MKAIREFYGQVWIEVTQNMQPWFKWTAGVSTYVVVAALIPVVAIFLLATLPVWWLLSFVADRVRGWFFK